MKKVTLEEIKNLKERTTHISRKTNFSKSYERMKAELNREIKDGKEILYKGRGKGTLL